ncbi:oligosaccharide flippase family protein [Methylophilaceae bacterium]|nr:oligosaccharide flippase family protein [Methylophilaceae bacterium]
MIKKNLQQLSSRMLIMLYHQLAVIITLPWLALKLSPSVFGLVSTALILIQTGWVLIDWGLINYSTEIWKRNSSLAKRNSLITNLIASRQLLSIIYLIFILILIGLGVIILPWQFLLPFVLSTFVGAIFPLWFFHVNRSTKELLSITLISRLIFVCLVMLMVRDDSDVITYLYLHSLSFLVITFYSFYRMRVKYFFYWQGFSINKVNLHIKKSTAFFINSLTNSHVHIIWSFAVTITQGPIIIGLYSIAEQGYRAGSAVSNSVAEVLRLNSKDLSILKIWRVTFFYMASYFFVGCISFIFADTIVRLFFEPEYYGSIYILKILIGVWLIQSYIKLLNYPLLGKLITISKLHEMSSYILIAHLIIIALWFYFKGGIDWFTLSFFSASLIQLSLLIIRIKHQLNLKKNIF